MNRKLWIVEFTRQRPQCCYLHSLQDMRKWGTYDQLHHQISTELWNRGLHSNGDGGNTAVTAGKPR